MRRPIDLDWCSVVKCSRSCSVCPSSRPVELSKWLEPLEKLRFDISAIPTLIDYIKQVGVTVNHHYWLGRSRNQPYQPISI